MDVIAQEREWERQRTFFEATERTADYRAGMVASQILNANRANASDKVWTPADFFPHLASEASSRANRTRTGCAASSRRASSRRTTTRRRACASSARASRG
jgi:hypothetical protein